MWNVECIRCCRYEAYNQAVAAAGGPAAPPVRLAVFGLGRAGSIHLANILANPRVVLAYVVESDTARWEAVRARWNLTDTQFVHPDQADVVYADPRLAACLVCTPTFTHEKFIVDSLQVCCDRTKQHIRIVKTRLMDNLTNVNLSY